MLNFIQKGETLDLTPSTEVLSGVGFLFGTSLFGVATGDVASGQSGAFVTEGVVEIAKTSALQIDVGDKVYWNAGSKLVNKTATAQQNVGVCVEQALNPSSTVKIKLGSVNAVAT